MTIRHLQIFAAVCRFTSMTKAAEALHMTQPAISTAIAEMEKNYGVILFERIHQRLLLTEKGKELYQQAQNALSAFAEFENSASSGKEDATVRIGATLTIGKILVPSLFSILREKLPDAAPRIRICKAKDIETALLHGELDFALAEGEIAAPDLNRSPFASDRLAVVCGYTYPFPEKADAALLSQAPLLVREAGSASRTLLDSYLAANAAKPLLESASNEAILAAAQRNAGIAVLPYSLVKDALRMKTVREIQIDQFSFARNFYLVMHKNKRFTKTQEAVYALCKELPSSLPDFPFACPNDTQTHE